MKVCKSAIAAMALTATSAFADEAPAVLDRADNGFILMSAMLVLLMSYGIRRQPSESSSWRGRRQRWED